MSKQIQTPEVGSALQSLFKLVGRVRPQLEEYVMPVVLVGDVGAASPPAVRRIYRAGGLTAAAGANFAQYTLFNNGANLVQLLSFEYDAVAGEFPIRFSFTEQTWGPPGFPTFAPIESMDRRALEGPGAALGYGDVTGLPPAYAGGLRIGTTQRPLELTDVILRPGDLFSITATTAAQNFYGMLTWQEFNLP